MPPIYSVYFLALFPLLKAADSLFPRDGFILQTLIWVAYEFAKIQGFLGYAYGIMGFSQYLFLPLARLSSLTGVWGVSLIVIFPSALLISLNLFWISTIHSYEVFIISGLVAGLGQGLIFPALSTYIIDKLGRDNKGLALGLYLALFDAGMGLGSPFFGWISDMAGYRVMYAVAALLLLLANLSFTWGSDQAK